MRGALPNEAQQGRRVDPGASAAALVTSVSWSVESSAPWRASVSTGSLAACPAAAEATPGHAGRGTRQRAQPVGGRTVTRLGVRSGLGDHRGEEGDTRGGGPLAPGEEGHQATRLVSRDRSGVGATHEPLQGAHGLLQLQLQLQLQLEVGGAVGPPVGIPMEIWTERRHGHTERVEEGCDTGGGR